MMEERRIKDYDPLDLKNLEPGIVSVVQQLRNLFTETPYGIRYIRRNEHECHLVEIGLYRIFHLPDGSLKRRCAGVVDVVKKDRKYKTIFREFELDLDELYGSRIRGIRPR